MASASEGVGTAAPLEEVSAEIELDKEESTVVSKVEEVEVKVKNEGKEGVDDAVNDDFQEQVPVRGEETGGKGRLTDDGEEEGGGDDEEGKDEEAGEEKGGKKSGGRKRRGSSSRSKERATSRERPIRARKLVERFSVSFPAARSSATKQLPIAKGSGTAFKDIPNVAFKLSKRKPDDDLQLLHTILFGKRAKARSLKKDIGSFSGFMWIENEDKQRAKVKEKLDKCMKEKLVDFCDLLNIPINRATHKKEVISEKILEFLESPHATTDALLADKEQKGTRRKRKVTPIKSTSRKDTADEKSAKKVTRRKRKVTPIKSTSSKDTADEKSIKVDSEVDDKDKSLDPIDNSMDEDDSDGAHEEESESEDKDSKKEEEPTVQITSPKILSTEEHPEASLTNRKSLDSTSKRTPESSSPHSQAKGSYSEKQKVETESPENKPVEVDKKGKSKQQSSKFQPKSTAKDQGKEKAKENAKAQPSRAQLLDVTTNILKEVDFDTVTLFDVLQMLGRHFDVDLRERKFEVKEIIAEAIEGMSDEDDDDEEDGDDIEDENNDEDANSDKDGHSMGKNADDKDEK